MKEIMNVKETAEFLGISERMLRELISTNKIPHKRVFAKNGRNTGRILFSKRLILEWMEAEVA